MAEYTEAGDAGTDKPDTSTLKTDPSDDALIELARKQFLAVVDAESGLRKRLLADKRFADGEQWDTQAKSDREANGDPCLTIDLLGPQIKQIKNQQRAMRPAVTVIAKGDGARPDIAEVFQGIIRHIEANSDADDAYDQAGSDQAEVGIGWFKIVTEYCDDEGDTANQDIKIERVRNLFSIYADPAAKRRDRSDMRYLFETSDYTPEALKEAWPKAKYTSSQDFKGIGDEGAQWINGEKIRVARYWFVKTSKDEKTLADGRKRTVKTDKVFCKVITGLEVLESYDWAGKYIPFVPVLGEERDTEGSVDLRGIIRGSKDSQRMFNYQKSKAAEVLALAPLAPFIAEEGQIEGHEDEWKASNRTKFAVLKYKRTGLDGTPDPPPARNFGEPPIQAILAEAHEAQQLIEVQTGFFNANYKNQGKESGVAIQERRMQGEHGNSDYLDGLARAIRYAGRILIDLIPKIIDVPRVMHILGKDNQPKTVMVHAGSDNAPAQNEIPEGVKDIYNLGVGKYDVTVTAGTNYITARQQFTASMETLFQSNPHLFQIIGDLYFENLDVPEGRVIAARLKKMLPPQLQDQNQDPQALAAQAGQLKQALDQAQAELGQAKQAIATDQVKQQGLVELKKLELEFQRYKLERDSETKIAVAELGAKVDRLALFMEERARLGVQAAEAEQNAHDRAHDVGMAAMDQAHTVDNSERAAANAQTLAAVQTPDQPAQPAQAA